MALSEPDEDLLREAVTSRRDALEKSLHASGANRAEQVRRASEAHEMRERLGRGLIQSAGIDRDDLEAMRQHDANEAQAYLDSQRAALVERGSLVAANQRRTADQLATGFGWVPQPLSPQQLVFRSLVTLDTVTAVSTSTPVSEPDLQFTVQVQPATSMHNVVKALAEERSHVQRGFHVPGLPITFHIDFLFTWTADADVALNAITFVQPNGMYALLASWAAFATSDATLDLTTGLDLFIVNPSGRGFVTSSGTRDHGLSGRVDVGWFDFLGAADVGAYSDQSTLFDNNFVGAQKGSLVIFNAWVALTEWTDGDATSLLDFSSGDFGINVPAVFVPTFTAA